MADAFFSLLGMINPPGDGALRLVCGTVTRISPLEVTTGELAFSGNELRRNAQYTPMIGDRVLMITEDYQLCHIICKEVGE